MTNKFIAYTRVSTLRQGSLGVSLEEQRSAIDQYARQRDLEILDWYEEVATAAKKGRPVFAKVIDRLQSSSGEVGLLMHKIDRGVRNLRDWADIGDVIDMGVEVRFVHDDLEMQTRGGRLTADIQAVVAADYIRNLKEEVKKGMTGRLKQGFYPFKAPRGYLDCGPRSVKLPHPVEAPLVITAFKRFATGAYSLRSLSEEMASLGMTNDCGAAIRAGTMSRLLRNRFYIGACVSAETVFQGQHQPLVSNELFERVQKVLASRSRPKRRRHTFRYQRSLKCRLCGRFLIGEHQKGRVYYRCHSCRGVCVREDRIEAQKYDLDVVKFVDPKDRSTEPYEKFESPLP